MEGDFPFNNFIKFIIGLPLLLFILSWFDILHESISSNTMFYIERFGRAFTLAVPSLFCISYSCSGVTWYTDSQFIYDILSLVEICVAVVKVNWDDYEFDFAGIATHLKFQVKMLHLVITVLRFC